MGMRLDSLSPKCLMSSNQGLGGGVWGGNGMHTKESACTILVSTFEFENWGN